MKAAEIFSQEFIREIEEQLLHAKMPDDDLSIEYVDPLQFLSPDRIDLVCKLYYIECRERKKGIDFAKEVYQIHLESITHGTFREVWNPEKNTLDKYFQDFDSMIDDMKVNGFDVKKSIIPVAQDNNILDGSHRVAIAIFFGIKVPIVRLRTPSWKNNYLAFTRKNQFSIPEKYMDFIAYQYMVYKRDCYVSIIWPISYHDPNYEIALKVINDQSWIVYSKEVNLNYNGLAQLAMHSYMDAEWTGGIKNRYSEIFEAVDERYCHLPTTVIILDEMPLQIIKKLKTTVRLILHDGFSKIHITDTQEESLRLGKMLLNHNSIDFLNRSYIFKYDAFIDDFFKFRSIALSAKLEDDVCLDTGAVLAIYGIRSTNDIDYLQVSDQNCDALSEYDKHSQQYYNRFGTSLICENIIYNWFHHFYCFDIMFSSLDFVKTFKGIRNESKDRRDIKLINRSHVGSPYERDYRKRKVHKICKKYMNIKYYYRRVKSVLKKVIKK